MASRLARARGLVLPRVSPLTISGQNGICRGAIATSTSSNLAPLPSCARQLHKTVLVAQNPIPDLREQDTPVGRMYKAEMDYAREWDQFHKRHIGPRDEDIQDMLKAVELEGKSLDDFIKEVIPEGVLQTHDRNIVPKHVYNPERKLLSNFSKMARQNRHMTWMNGQGYYPIHVPTVIKRNLLENPGWYTSYTPYQAEISQGRLQSLLNFQTMVSDLTGLPVANASLLDEGTAAAEAMTLSMNALPTSRAKRASKTYVVSTGVNRRTQIVMSGRAEGFGINLLELDLNNPDSLRKIKNLGDDLVGVMVQYPDTSGRVHDYKSLAETVHEQGALLSAATDLSALTVLTPPGEWGADIAFGNSQRFGVPLGNGGPHAAFFSVKEANKRRLPGRLIGVTKDRLGRPALRLALQTREQHIRREKATSNVCTAQALLANMAAMYAVYHGPAQLKAMALDNIRQARIIAELARSLGHEVVGSSINNEDVIISDTIAIRPATREAADKLVNNLRDNRISTSKRKIGDHLEVTLSVSNNLTPGVFKALAAGLGVASLGGHQANKKGLGSNVYVSGLEVTDEAILDSVPSEVRRTSSFLTHPVFNTYHSETEMLRYLHHLQSKDLSQVHSMIPLGSCTMKLNPTSAMELITVSEHSDVHPLASPKEVKGYSELMGQLHNQLANLTGMHSVSIQPNSGAQGEFAGLRVIRAYLAAQPEGGKRDICLIPVSAHGTNPASASMVGMRTVPIKCEATGNLDLEDLKAKCAKHAHELGAIMITYPSTFGVFEPYVKEVCEIVHEHGGLVYMDGANMNAQIGLMSPGELGADICHLNLHKTFCIPHGGGGPGVGPICAVSRLTPYMPGGPVGISSVASAPSGSASILPISWAYMAMMGKFQWRALVATQESY